MAFPGIPEYMVDFVYPPISGTAGASDTCLVKATTTAASSIDLTTFASNSNMARILNENTDYLYVMMSDTQAHAELVDGTAVAGAGQCWAIPAGMFIDVVTTSAFPWLGFRCKTGAGFVRITCSSIGTNGGSHA